MANHYFFPYDFTSGPNEGISFDDLYQFTIGEDLLIFYDDWDVPNYVAGLCSRWDADNYLVTVETWLNKTQVEALRNNIVPGASKELYNILGSPTFKDITWTDGNTLRLRPNQYERCHHGIWYKPHGSNLPYMRGDIYIYVKNFSTSPIGRGGHLNVKIEGYISGSKI